MRQLQRIFMTSSVLLAGLALAACAVEWQNARPAQELARQARPEGSVYAGWRVFQERCARCHGPAATGTADGPDLMPRMREMGPRRFVGLVLQRYDWAAAPGAGREAWIEEALAGREGPMTMPAWQGEPQVQAHIADLYAYLSARSQGTQGPERPSP